MKKYDFLFEAIETYNGGNNLVKDSWEAIKAGLHIDSLSDFKNKHPSATKGIKITAATGSASYSYYLAILNGIMAKRISKIIKRIEKLNDREKATNVLIRIRKAPVTSEVINVNNVKDTLSPAYELSSKIIGPAIQIINNKNDSLWKEHLIQYLSRQRKLMLVKASIIHPITGTVTGAAIYKLLKK